MNPGRRATPDSEAVGSSEDERPWPSSTSFGQIPMRETSVPGLPGGIWAQKRGSFKMSEPAKRNALHDVRLTAGNVAQNALRAGNTPSPSSDRASGTIPFSIPLQPVAKTGRSLSHSQGQREQPRNNVLSHHAMSNAGTHNNAMPLALLAEEADTESESEMGGRLTHTLSHPPIGTLLRTSTLPAGFDGYGALSNGRPHHDSLSPVESGSNHHERILENSFANLNFDTQPRRAQWQSSLGWDGVRNVNESRRHSLADIPTRRGSLAGVGESGFLSRAFASDVFDDDPPHNMAASTNFPGYSPDRNTTSHGDNYGGGHSQSGSANFDIPHNYRAPHVDLNERERSELGGLHDQPTGAMQPWAANNHSNRPRRQLYIVSFKCSRVDVFFLLEGTGLTVREGDLVIVEADRGQDLGTVQHANVSPEMARALKKKYNEEQYKWLMMYSHNKEGASNPNAELQRDNPDRPYYAADAPTTLPGNGNFPRDATAALKPKAIKRLAQHHEIKMLAEKEGNEAKAKRTCQQKVSHLRLQMEILDAEWQWDFQKLIFYYYADHYINFKDLITELYRIYKTRIWLSAINPASFSQHAINQPPSGIGPGAVTPFNPYGMNSAYTMAYGEDRDPYGAQMPYRIGYETYTPNFPAIPGVPNSYAPGTSPYILGFYPGSAPGQPGALPASMPPSSENAAASMDPATLAQRQYEWNSLYNGAGGAMAQPRATDLNGMPLSMQSADATRPTYGFGARNANNGPRGNNWDRGGRGSVVGRGPGLPTPIGTRPLSNGDELNSQYPYSTGPPNAAAINTSGPGVGANANAGHR